MTSFTWGLCYRGVYLFCYGCTFIPELRVFFFFLDVGWFKRHTANTAHPSLQVQEGSAGTLNFKLSQGIKTTEKTISLGEEHSETLPNGESTRVSIIFK